MSTIFQVPFCFDILSSKKQGIETTPSAILVLHSRVSLVFFGGLMLSQLFNMSSIESHSGLKTETAFWLLSVL